MGTQFFWFYDILIIGIVLAITFKCYKKGFVSVVVRFASLLAAFALAISLSGPLSGFIYDKVISDRVTEYIDNGVNDLGGDNFLYELSRVDTEKIKVNNIPVSEINLEPDSAGKITLDISNLDLSETKLPELDLKIFGINPETTDFSKFNAGKVNVAADDLKSHELGDIILSKALAQAIEDETYGTLSEMFEQISDAVPFFGNDININDSIAKIIRAIIEADTNDITASMVDGLIKPMILPLLNAIAFFFIFALSALILSVLAKMFKFINRVPVIGKINALFGAVIGFFEGMIIIALVAIFVNIIITLTGNTIVLLNTATIDNTFIFKHIYNHELLNIKL